MMSTVPKLSEILPKQKLRQQLHISGINMMSECGQRFFYRYVLGIKRPPSAFLLVGSSTDESVTKNLDNKIETGELLPRNDVLGIAEAKFDALQKADPIELDADEKKEGLSVEQVLGDAKDKTVALAGLHNDEAAPKIQPKRTQRKFSINMDTFLRQRAKELHEAAETVQDGYTAKRLHAQARAMNATARVGLDFAGEQDIVEQDGETLIVRDTKTSGKSPTKSLMDGSSQPGIADDSDQLTGYALASHVIDGKLPDFMVLDYLVRTPARHDLKYIPTKTTRDMNDVQVFLNRFANAVQAYKTGVFVPAKADWWGCSEKWCAYWDRCPYAKRPKLFQIKTEVPK
jgi:hypothetical protein